VQGIDLDAIEEMMNRRMQMIWVRHPWAVVVGGFFLFVGLCALAVYLTAKPTMLRIAVGPEGSDDVKFVELLAKEFEKEHASIRIQPLTKQDAVSVRDIRGKPEFDLAVVRGNMTLSQDWPVVAILRQNVVALIVPAPGAYAPLKPVVTGSGRNAKTVTPKRAKIEKVSDLVDKTVGIVAGTDGGPELLNVILNHYGVPVEKVRVEHIEPQNLKGAIYDNKVDVVLVAGPQTGKAIGDAVVAASSGKEGPTFIAIDQAEGIGKRTPPYDEIEIKAGAFGGVPPQPSEDLTTLSYPLFLVARRTLNDDKISSFSKQLYSSRQALAYDLPRGAIAIESPSTDKDSSVLVHPGTAAYLGDNTKSFFDRYGDAIFYGMLIIPALGSMLAGGLGYFRADRNSKRIRQLHRLLQIVQRAREVDSLEELAELQDEADAILGETIQQAESGSLDEVGIASFSLAIEQARSAISEQRTVLVLLRPDNAAQRITHRPAAISQDAAE
jgi:hypothetical protein